MTPAICQSTIRKSATGQIKSCHQFQDIRITPGSRLRPSSSSYDDRERLCCTNRVSDGMTPTPGGPMPQQPSPPSPGVRRWRPGSLACRRLHQRRRFRWARRAGFGPATRAASVHLRWRWWSPRWRVFPASAHRCPNGPCAIHAGTRRHASCVSIRPRRGT